MHPLRPRRVSWSRRTIEGARELSEPTNLDGLFEVLDVRLEAFAICAIGRSYSLQCEPHDEVLLHFVLRGEGFLECEHGSFRLRPGMITIIPRGTAKCLRGNGPIEHVCAAAAACHPHKDLMQFRTPGGNSGLLLGCAVLDATVGRALPLLGEVRRPIFAESSNAAVHGLFAVMVEELRRPQQGTRAFLSAVMKQLLILLVRSGAGGGRTLSHVRGADPRLLRAAQMVLGRPAGPHSVSALAEEAAMSRARFSECFSAAYGCTPMTFVQKVRLEAAAALLVNSDLPVKAVAASVGYASRSNFSRAFSEDYGQHPTAFRRRYRTSTKRD